MDVAKPKPETEEKIYRVLPRQVDATVAAALREWLPGRSWEEVRKLIKARRVMLSGNLCVDAARRLKLQDVVKILPHSMAPPPSEKDVRILYLDAQVVVVEKPSGVTSTRHSEEADWPARRRQIQPTLDEMLPAIIAKKLEQGKKGTGFRSQKGSHPNPLPRGEGTFGRGKGRLRSVRAVHRLDRETSGVMVFARTAAAEKHLAQQFRKHTTARRYVAIAMGEVKTQTIRSRLVRDRGDGRRGSTKLVNAGKPSVTHVKPLERIGNYTLIECRPETGRTHQIRIHLSEAGHPLCGEKIYLQPLFQPPLKDISGAPRLALHAADLAFQHPMTDEVMQFESALPADLKEFLVRLREINKG
jgi:23S rRNA pseudouridine1911/1915/1917 synthase